MGSEEEEPNLSENLLTVRKEQSGLFTPRLEHIKACARVGGRVIQVMTVASEGNITQGTRESEGIYIPSEGVLASGTYESPRCIFREASLHLSCGLDLSDRWTP